MKKFKHTNADLEMARIQTENAKKAREQNAGAADDRNDKDVDK